MSEGHVKGLLIGIQVVCVWLFAFGLYMLARNEAVYKFRGELIEEWSFCANKLIRNGKDYKIALAWYESLPTYNTMFNRFWVWPLGKFVPERCHVYVERELEKREREAREAEAKESQPANESTS